MNVGANEGNAPKPAGRRQSPCEMGLDGTAVDSAQSQASREREGTELSGGRLEIQLNAYAVWIGI